MPAGQGAVNWPVPGLSAAALVFDEELPLPDAAIDRVLMVHSLEFAESPRETLKELWRVLAPARPPRYRRAEPPRALGAHRQHTIRHGRPIPAAS